MVIAPKSGENFKLTDPRATSTGNIENTPGHVAVTLLKTSDKENS